MPIVVAISEVISQPRSYSPLAVRKVKAILQKQGLIEPLMVEKGGPPWRIKATSVWDNERLVAARELGWDTVIITDGKF